MSGFLHCSGKDLEFGIAGERKLSDLDVSFGLLAKTARQTSFDQTITGTLLRNAELREATGIVQKGRGQFRRAKERHVAEALATGDALSIEDANKLGAVVNITFDQPRRREHVELMIQRERERILREAIFARAESDMHLVAAVVGAEVLMTAEPGNLLLTLLGLPIRVVKLAVRLGKVLGPRLGPKVVPILLGAAEGLKDFVATQVFVEVDRRKHGEGRDEWELFQDMMVAIGAGAFVGHFRRLFRSSPEGSAGSRNADDITTRGLDGSGNIPEGPGGIGNIPSKAARSAAEAGVRTTAQQLLQQSDAEDEDRRFVEGLSTDERVLLLDGYTAALAQGRIPANDEVLLFMRLLDQDNEINRRPPNSGFAGPIQ